MSGEKLFVAVPCLCGLKLLTDLFPSLPSHVDKLHKSGIRMCPKSSDQFPDMILSFQVNNLQNRDPAWQIETRPMLATVLDKAIKKKFDNHVSSHGPSSKRNMVSLVIIAAVHGLSRMLIRFQFCTSSKGQQGCPLDGFGENRFWGWHPPGKRKR